jgi:4-amino-4-deoxy-L-arabinose transferase-like glycosyltransferase
MTLTFGHIRRFARTERWLLAALAVAGAAQLTFTVVVDPHARCAASDTVDTALAREGLAPQERCLTDATAYHLLGRELAARHAYERPFDRVILGVHRPTAEYPPLFPTVLALADGAGIDSIAAQQIVVGTLGAIATALAAGLFARSLRAPPAAVALAALATAVHPALLQAHALLMTEGIFAALATLALVAALHAARQPVALRLATTGALLGLAALTRGEGIVWVAAIAFAIAVGQPRASIARRAAAAAVVVAVAAAVVAPWTIRNHARFGELVPVSNNLGTVLDGANCELTYSGPTLGAWRSTFSPTADAPGDRDTPCFEGFRIEDPAFSETAAAARARREGIDYAFDHAGDWPKVVVARLGRTFGAFRPGQQIDLEVLEGRVHGWQRGATVLWWVTAPLAIAGVAYLARARRRPAVAVAAAPWLAAIATTVVSYGNQRFRAGLDPAAIVLAVLAIAAVARKRATSRTVGSATAA